ncbi:MAG: glycerate kinase type-2 family protein [Gammaproteobacteria bacterium]
MHMTPQDLLGAMFDAAVASAQPAICVPEFLPEPPKGRTIVIGAGKASAAMARALEDNWEGELTGLVVTRYGYAVDCERIEILEAAHPVPDQAGMDAARRMLEFVQGLSEDDLVICLISGGGSALLPLPMDGLSLEEKQNINRALLACGATISEINCVRRQLSAIKGGRLAAACHPARVVNLLISDVPGDNPMDIASGPTVIDQTGPADALEIIDRYGIDIPAAVRERLESGDNGAISEELKNEMRIETRFIAAPQMMLEAAAAVADEAGIPAYILSDRIEGEAADVAGVHAGIVQQIIAHDQPFSRPCVLLSGGECTVTIKGKGRGGPNAEFLLALALALDGLPGVEALAADTDGVDGADEIAGAMIDSSTLARAWEHGINPRQALENNDAHGFFEALGDSLVPGPTMTNVNDFRAILIEDE